MHTYQGFAAELQKISARRDVTQLLSSLAERKGLRPSMVPGIRQAGTVANVQGKRSRAAEIAGNVRSFLKSPTAGGASSGARSSPKLPAAPMVPRGL